MPFLCEVFMTLAEFFKKHPKVAIAFSGGVDSAYLLYAAIKYGAKVRAYYVKSEFQPDFELNDARLLAKELQADIKVIPLNVLELDAVAKNPKDRCYHCKKAIFGAIVKAAAKDGFDTLLDGTNASDDASDRPGMRALAELNVLSPLAKCGLSKAEIRRLSKEAGLFTWDKPAYACLATRISTGEPITAKKLEATQSTEDALFSLGFSDFRVRVCGETAKLELPEAQFEKLIQNRELVLMELKKHYLTILLDLEGRG